MNTSLLVVSARVHRFVQGIAKMRNPGSGNALRGKRTLRSGRFGRFLEKLHLPQEMIAPILCTSLQAIFPLIHLSNSTNEETV